ncbi:TIGR04219 family outer membrane beta-barrel protein [Moritella sp. F3]|uniref:TIGR04219 family outer membrane beta-barrel protein n=1 Tax=Moritella sp. F3 TaxID=2718882 RepID=UPI0018E1C580|nr:TIGR04219 family outer membrane beta-barrel protein [Moritella sp. F3]GIC75980.1 outer membrane protein [Moritella sp. F1]GIC81519.1 outer membrane protein [Moritella sp. F3]
MKKQLLALTLLTGLSNNVMADAIGTYFGADVWQSGVDGTMSYKGDDLATGGYEDTYNYRMYVKVEHPIPLIPNAALSFSNVDVEGSSANENVNLKTVDFTLYYEFLDNDIVSLDAGVTWRQLNGTFEDGSTDVSFSGPLPMGYAYGEVGLPMFPLKAFAMVNAIGITGDVYGDAEIGLAFMLNPGYVLDWSIRAGYRIQQLDFKVDDVKADATIDGVFVGLEGHF